MKHLLLLLFIPIITISQSLNNNNQLFNELDNEEVKLKTNAEILYTGDNLKYSMDVLSINAISNYSKVGYVQLIAHDNLPVFKHKIDLKNGNGFGDYFIDTELKTGNYKLIAFTNWSKNNKNGVVIKDIIIINPFNSKKLKGSNTNTIILEKDSLINYNPILNPKINLNLNKSIYSKREEILINIDLDSSLINGNYTLLINKIDSISKPNFKDLNLDLNIANTKYVPELRGQIIYGNLTRKDKKEINNLFDISLSVRGDNGFTKITKTDKKGNFYFNITNPIYTDNLDFQVLNHNSDDYIINIEKNEGINTESLTFSSVIINKSIKECIEKTNIYNQIENAYITKKKDSTIKITKNKEFYYPYGTTFKLDDYNRFKTLKETFIEVISTAGIRKNDDKYYFLVYENESNIANNTIENLHPLILVDGLLIQEAEDIINIDARTINTITTVKEQYYYGSKLYNGIIDIKTFDNNFNLKPFNSKIITKKSSPIQVKKIYFTPDYSTNNYSNIPDYRRELLWLPILSENKKNIKTFTSDIPGKYKVYFSGYNQKGEFVEVKKFITVN